MKKTLVVKDTAAEQRIAALQRALDDAKAAFEKARDEAAWTAYNAQAAADEEERQKTRSYNDLVYDRVQMGVYGNYLPYPHNTDPLYKEKLARYQAMEGQLYNEFKQDLFKEAGIENNPKRDILFSKAWERGHSSGFSEVHGCFHDLLELIVD